MRQLLFLTFNFCLHYLLTAQAFITTWKTDNPGKSGPNQIRIPTTGDGYNYSIYWEQVNNSSVNGTIAGPITGGYTITFPSPGTYRIQISGAFPRMYFNGSLGTDDKDYEKIISINQWGNNAWLSMEHAFDGCKYLTIPATDAPNLTYVTDLSYMFRGAISLNHPVEHWEVSAITNMNGMFDGAISFNQPIAQWNVSKVTSMATMFYGCENFNQPLNQWDISNVSSMRAMFYGCDKFNQPLDNWNTSSTTDMALMFADAYNFNQSIENWDVSKVTDMNSMFSGATDFNQPIGNWDVSKVTNMAGMFNAASSFNQPIGGWNVSNVKDMGVMFSFAWAFNQPLNDWNVEKVTSMIAMFDQAVSFNQPLGNWKFAPGNRMMAMLRNTMFNHSLKTWNITEISEMGLMLDFTAMSTANYDETLISWAAQEVKANVALGAATLKYCLSAEARAQLILKGWVITNDISLVPPKPELTITQPICHGETGAITVINYNTNDMFSFNGGLTFQLEPSETNLLPGQHSILVQNESGCTSPEQIAEILKPNSKPLKPTILGSGVVCPNVLDVDYSATNSGYTYQWYVAGGNISNQQNQNIKVIWGGSNFNAAVKAVGFDQHNCPTDTAIFPVKIQIKLKPTQPEGFDSVCFNFRGGVPYKTSYSNGSTYTWFTNGGDVVDGQSTQKVKISWRDIGTYQIWVKEENTTSTDFCEGLSDTLNVTIFRDLAAITLNFVSVDYTDVKKIELQWEVSLLERISDLVIVSRRLNGADNPWKVIATIDKNTQAFLDQTVSPSTETYEYKVEGFNKCDEGLQTVIHNTMLLAGDKEEINGIISLNWNDYNGWDEVDHYEVWRKLDNEPSLKLLDITPGDLTTYSGKYGADGFVHHLRIKAKKKDANTISWSNEVVLDFENPIDFIPNVITPDNDGQNDFFVIPKLNLYPDNVLVIYNRWNQVVYSTRKYGNTWNAQGLPNGIYFYSLDTNGSQGQYRGWIQVVR